MKYLCTVCHKVKYCNLCIKNNYTFGRYMYSKDKKNIKINIKLKFKKFKELLQKD